MNKLQVVLGENVRRLRNSALLTQSQLAEVIGRSTDLISRIERGETAPSFETLEKICDALNTTAAALFGGPAMSRSAETPSELGRLMDRMSAEELAWLSDLLRVALAQPGRPPAVKR